MFPWNIAQVFLKKAFKFVLKKKLGHLILGDIDLDQLDLQLAKGILNLSDLALNADYLNQQLSEAGSVVWVREGSIRSLSVKFPWSGYGNWNWNGNSQGGCQVEVDELELVLSPFSSCSHRHSHHDDSTTSYDIEKGKGKGKPDDHEDVSTSSASSLNLHKGVKRVANVVQHLLTNFHISIQNVIVAFDTCDKEDDGKSHHTLVLRVNQIECGTCMDDELSSDGAKPCDILGMTHLVNFLKFQGAVLEFVCMDTDFDQTPLPDTASPASRPLLIGQKGSFGGSVNLSIPWKNGSLDIQKLNADFRLDPIIAKLQPSTLKWILTTWDLLQNSDNKKGDNVLNITADTLLASAMLSDKKTLGTNFPIDSGVLREKTIADVLLKESQFISDWIPLSNQSEGFEDADLGASVDQFFECFDEMRSSHSVLGNSGVWSWTCSVFSAITAASNLASGSLNIPSEQQHVQTNLKVTLSGVSAIFSSLDEDLCLETDSSFHRLGLVCEDIVISVQVYPQNWKLEATVATVVLNDYFNQKEECLDFALHDRIGIYNGQSLAIRDLQDKIQSSLPIRSVFGDLSNVKPSDASNNLEALSSLICSDGSECIGNIVTATLCQTAGAFQCLFSASSRSHDGSSSGRAYLSLKLPPFIFWVSFDLVSMVLDFMRELGEFPGKCRTGTESSSNVVKEKHEASAPWSPSCYTAHSSRRANLTGSVFLPRARIILCFPFSKGEDLRNYTSWNQFIALDFSSVPNLKLLDPEEPPSFRENKSRQTTLRPCSSMHLNVANLDVYHVMSSNVCDVGMEIKKFCAHRILSFGNGAKWNRLISMVWNECAVTGAGIMKSAKLYATSQGPAHTLPSTGYEFTSVSSMEHEEDLVSLKKKLVLSSKFCVHVCVPAMVVTLSRSQYLCLSALLNEATNAISIASKDINQDNQGLAVNQSAITVECGMVEIILELGDGDCPKSSLQRELPGLWQSLRLEVQNLELLYISDIGAVGGAHFLCVSHGEGMLWGTISTCTDHCFRLISCSNTSNGRGDGEGSNFLSCWPAGSDFVYLSDPESSHEFNAIILKCWTIVAPGGRLDWLDKISSFFHLPPPEICQGADHTLEKGHSQSFFFALKFIDGALSYEPYIEKTEMNEACVGSGSQIFVSLDESSLDPNVACLLSASSVTLSNTKLAENLENDFYIRVQDVGLLLHEVSKSDDFLDDYNVSYLREVGYVKVAGEAVLNAILRINSEDDISWELCCSESHIVLRTCHDTMSGLIRLASQLQRLFAPDIEESLVHLQNRWNCFQQAQGRDDFTDISVTSSTSAQAMSESQQLVLDSKHKSVGLMGEICEDAFLLSGKGVKSAARSQLTAVDRFDEGPSSSETSTERFLNVGHTSVSQKAETVDGYCLSDLRSLSEITTARQCREDISTSNLVNSGSDGWYGRTPLKIVENYVADATKPSCSKEFEGQLSDKECNSSAQPKGRVVLKDVEVKWQMYAGSDWHELGQSDNICGRDGSVCLELALSNMNIQYDIFPDGDIHASKLCLSVQDFCIYDHSRNAPWKLVLGYYYSKEHPRQSLSKAFKLDLEAVRPDSVTPLEEYRLQLAVLPLLLHLHQSQLDFLVSFFGAKSSLAEQHGGPCDSGQSDVSFGSHNKLKGSGIAEEALLPFFQKLDIWPIVVRVDYRPSRVDLAALSEGKYVELVNLVPWKGVELHLKHVQACGIYGWSNVCETAIGEWLEDISHNQIHKLLKGLPTIRSFVAVGSGAAKLISLPVKNYRKDYRLVKGLQRGTISFLRSISVEALGLGVHLAAGAHDILLHAECILARIQPSVPRPIKGNLKANLGSEQPQDAQHGLQQAYESLSDGFGKCASALIRTPLKTYQRGASAGSALVTAVRGAPAAAIAPASAAAQALHCALVGVRNSLEPERKEESMNKYLGPSVSRKHR